MKLHTMKLRSSARRPVRKHIETGLEVPSARRGGMSRQDTLPEQSASYIEGQSTYRCADCIVDRVWRRFNHFVLHIQTAHRGTDVDDLVKRSSLLLDCASATDCNEDVQAATHSNDPARADSHCSTPPNHDRNTSTQNYENVTRKSANLSRLARSEDSGMGLRDLRPGTKRYKQGRQHAHADAHGKDASKARQMQTKLEGQTLQSQDQLLLSAGASKAHPVLHRRWTAPTTFDSDGYVDAEPGPQQASGSFWGSTYGSTGHAVGVRPSTDKGKQPIRGIDDRSLILDQAKSPKLAKEGRAIYPCVRHRWGFGPDTSSYCKIREEFVSKKRVHHGNCHSDTHGRFFYCTKCFRTNFTSDDDAKRHKEERRCSFKCATVGCPNYDNFAPFRNPCLHGHGNSQDAIWTKLYRLAWNLDDTVWVPNPQLDVQSPPNLPDHHPMSANHQALASSSGPTIESTPLEPQHADQSTWTDTPLGPNDAVTNDTTNRLATSVRSLETVADMLWQHVNREVPTWGPSMETLYHAVLALMPEDTQPAMQIDVLERLDRLPVILLSQLIREYGRLIQDPSSRTREAWQNVALMTQRILLVPPPSHCPWLAYSNAPGISMDAQMDTQQSGRFDYTGFGNFHQQGNIPPRWPTSPVTPVTGMTARTPQMPFALPHEWPSSVPQAALSAHGLNPDASTFSPSFLSIPSPSNRMPTGNTDPSTPSEAVFSSTGSDVLLPSVPQSSSRRHLSRSASSNQEWTRVNGDDPDLFYEGGDYNNPN